MLRNLIKERGENEAEETPRKGNLIDVIFSISVTRI